MSEKPEMHYSVPSDVEQIPIVWRYELLKYLRSKRLIAAVVIVAAVLALLYILPPALGHPYSGTDTEFRLFVIPIDYVGDIGIDPASADYVAFINRSRIDVDSVVIYADGVEYPRGGGANWLVTPITYQGMEKYVVAFLQDISGQEMTATYDWHASPEGFATNFMGFVNILVIICATLFGADAIGSEFQNRTGYLVFPNPIKRTVLWLGKFSASMTAGLMLILLFYAVVVPMSLVSARGLDDDYLLSLGFAVEFLLAATAIAYFISSLLRGTTGATVLTFLLFILILPIVDGVSMATNTKVEGSVTFAAGAIAYILMDPYPEDTVVEYMEGFNFGQFYPDPGTAAIVMLAYAVISILLSALMFRKKQLVG